MRDWNSGDENGLFAGRDVDFLFDDDGFFGSNKSTSTYSNMIDCRKCGHSYDEVENHYNCPICGTHSIPF